MNMKAMMFAGLGLFVAMVATTVWVNHDMAKIRERQEAKQQAACAAAAAMAASGPAALPVAGQSTDPYATAAAAPAPSNDAARCDTATTSDTAGTSSATDGDAAAAYEDPYGDPVDGGSDPYGASSGSDPYGTPTGGDPYATGRLPGTPPPMDTGSTYPSTDPAAAGTPTVVPTSYQTTSYTDG